MDYKNDLYKDDMYKEDRYKDCDKYKDDRYKEDKYKDDRYKDDKPEKKPFCDGRTVECNVYTDVSVPIEIEPKAKVGKVDVEPCGEPYVKCDCDCHKGHKIVITQKFLIKIPVCYEVKTKIGESEVDCDNYKDKR